MKFNRTMKQFIFSFLLVFAGSFAAFGQKYTETQLRDKLDSLGLRNAGLNNTVQLNISGLPLYEFVYSVGLENNLNITIDPSLNQTISYNFFDAKVKDILVFLYVNFELEYDFVGSIISVKKRTIKKETPVVRSTSKDIDVKFNKANEFLSMNLQNDTLWKVLEKVTVLSDKNFVINPEIRNKQVNAFFQNRPYEEVLDMFVKGNGLTLTKEKEGFYSIGIDSPKTANNGTSNSNQATNSGSRTQGNTKDFTLVKNSMGTLDVFANNIDLIEIVKAAAQELNQHYVLHSTVDGKANLELKNVSFDELLNNLFMTTKYNFSEKERIYVIGERKMEGVRKTEVIRMENRTIENVKTAIPKELLTDLDVAEFLELNALIVSGSDRGITELKAFLSSIDIVVPMIQIDVMLIFSSKSNTLKTGMEAGLKDQPTTTGGTIFPGLDVNMGASTINAILNAISGFGVLNLGQVTENFYASLSALETNNIIDIESTPKISTLNGQKASISIGETTYYQETQVNVQTSVTQQGVVQSKVWKSIDANLSVNIQPFVSSDEQITLTIKVDQKDFAGKADPSSPPNMTTQTFESMVRVKNGEVILLGGLEKKKNNNSGSGVPFLSRIPIIKWLFSGRSSEKSKSKLHILIKSTVTY